MNSTHSDEELRKQVHILACGILDLDDEDHEDDETAEPVEKAIMSLITQSRHDALQRVKEKMPKKLEAEARKASNEFWKGDWNGFNRAIDTVQSILDKEMGK